MSARITYRDFALWAVTGTCSRAQQQGCAALDEIDELRLAVLEQQREIDDLKAAKARLLQAGKAQAQPLEIIGDRYPVRGVGQYLTP